MKNGYSNDGLYVPEFQRKPPMHPFRPEAQGCIDNAYAVLALPLPMDTPYMKGPYHRGSLGWRQFDTKFQHQDMFRMALHLFTHALEIPGVGTPLFNGVPGSHGVRQAQMAYLRALEHRAKKSDPFLLRTDLPDQGIKHSLCMDQNVAEALHLFATGHFDKDIPGRGEGRAHDDDEDENIDDGIDADLGRRHGGGRRGRRRRGGDDDEDEDDMDPEMDPEDETDIAIEELFNQHLGGREGEKIIEKIAADAIHKVQIIVTHMTRPPRDERGELVPGNPPWEDAGCIVFFCIMDPLYSMGKALGRLIEMCEELNNHKMGVKSTGITDADSIPNGGGLKKRNFQAYGQAPRLIQHFPWLGEAEHRTNALHTLTMKSYLRLCSFVRNEADIMNSSERQKLLSRGISHPGTSRNPNKLHPLNNFTPEWACNVMRTYGVPESQCSMSIFKGGDETWDLDIDSALAANDQLVNSKWYFPPERSYHYLQEGWCWYRRGWAGLYQQYFPWVEVPAELAKLMSVRTETTALTAFEGNTENNNGLSPEWTASMIAVGVGVIDVLPQVPYDRNAISKHNSIAHVASENSKLMETLKGPKNPKATPEAYLKYCREVDSHRKACLMRMQQVLVPSDHIYPSMNKILIFMAQSVKRASTFLPHLTWNPHVANPETYEMTSFAQHMLRQAIDIKYQRHIVCEARHWQMTHYGAQDCHAMTNVDMHYSAIYHGLSQSGKSFMVKDATVKVMIDGTVSTMLETSRRAFNTHDDFVGVTLFKDELENIFVDAKAAERDKTGQAEQIKSMMTDHKTTYRCLVFVEQDNGRSKREAEDIEALYHATMLCCTNKRVNGGDEAIASRFLNFIMTRTDCDLHEYLGIKDRLDEEDSQINSDLVHSWRVKQALIALCQALIDSKVLPEPSMHAYDLIQSRVLAYLSDQGVNTKEIRGTQMVKRLARIYVILNMLLQLYDVPGAPYATKDFDLPQLLDGIPFLFCDFQISVFAITQTSEIYIHPVRAIVLRAAYSQARFAHVEGRTVEEYFRADDTKMLQWMLEKEGTPEERVNPNYLKLTGKYKENILMGLAENCKPRLGVNEVGAEMDAMTKVFITVKPFRKISMQHYKGLSGDSITKYVLLRENTVAKIPVVIRDFPNEMVYVALEALVKLDDNLILDAINSCVYEGLRPRKLLLGIHEKTPHPVYEQTTVYHTELYSVLTMDPEYIDTSSFLPCFAAPDVSYIEPSVRQIYTGPRRHPDKEAKGETYAKERIKRMEPILVIEEDIDDWAHEKHHYASACPGSHEESPSRPLIVRERIRRAMLAIEQQHDVNDRLPADQRKNLTYERAALLDYPDHIVHDKTERLRFANAARPFAEAQRAIQSLWELEMAEWKMLPPAERKVTPMPVLNRACNKTSTKALELSMGVAAKTIVNKHARLGALEAQQVYDFTKQMHRVTGGALALRQQQVKKIYASAPQEKWAAHADVAELHRRRKKHAKERAETAAAFDVVVVEDETLPTPPSRKRSSVIPLEDGEEAQDGFGGGGMEEVLDFEPMPAAPPKKHKQKEVSLTHAKKSAHRGGVTSPEEKARMLAESLSGGAWDQSE